MSKKAIKSGDPLTARQHQILMWMLANAKVEFPSVRTVAREFRLAPATVQEHIDSIRRKGAFHL